MLAATQRLVVAPRQSPPPGFGDAPGPGRGPSSRNVMVWYGMVSSDARAEEPKQFY